MALGYGYQVLLVLLSFANGEFLDECLAHGASFHYEGFCYLRRPSEENIQVMPAIIECIKDFPPHGRMAIIPNLDTMQHIFDDFFTPRGWGYEPYVAGKKSSGVWMWLGPDGRESPMGPGSHALWADGEPNGPTDVDCVTLKPNEGLNSISCPRKRYLCQYPNPSLHKHYFKSIKTNAKGVSSAAYNITGGVGSVHACINACIKEQKESEYCYSFAYSRQEKICIFYWVPAGVMQLSHSVFVKVTNNL